jgi:hypothetical protein
VDKLGAALGRIAEFLDRERPDASAAPVARLEDRDPLAGARQLAGRHQARGAGADDHEICQMSRAQYVCRSAADPMPTASRYPLPARGRTRQNSDCRLISPAERLG